MKKLKEIRLKNNYSFGKMSSLLGISKTQYWQIEHNQRKLYYDMAVKIANIFNTTPDEIFYNDVKTRIKN